MVADDPTLESFYDELDQVITRHNEVARQHGHGLLCAALSEHAGKLATDRNVDVEVQHHEHDGTPFTIAIYGDGNASVVGAGPDDIDTRVIADAVGGTAAFGVTDLTIAHPSNGGGRDA